MASETSRKSIINTKQPPEQLLLTPLDGKACLKIKSSKTKASKEFENNLADPASASTYPSSEKRNPDCQRSKQQQVLMNMNCKTKVKQWKITIWLFRKWLKILKLSSSISSSNNCEKNRSPSCHLQCSVHSTRSKFQFSTKCKISTRQTHLRDRHHTDRIRKALWNTMKSNWANKISIAMRAHQKYLKISHNNIIWVEIPMTSIKKRHNLQS